MKIRLGLLERGLLLKKGVSDPSFAKKNGTNKVMCPQQKALLDTIGKNNVFSTNGTIQFCCVERKDIFRY